MAGPADPVKQREFALFVLKTLRKAGYIAYWAGGCVRDQLLGRVPRDYDVATDARPEQIQQIFGRKRTFLVGAAFGVATVVGPPGAGQVEVTTFRSDATYSDGRHPDAVVFSTPQADALRRDFTINGLFYDPLEDRVLDFVGGIADLQAKIIRAIGDPRQRFEEDKLRMLRAIRFVAELEFGLDPATYQAIREMAPGLAQVSQERILMELERLLTAPGRVEGVRLLRSSGLLRVILPELEPHDPPQEELWETNCRVLHALREPGFPVAFAALCRRRIAVGQVSRICRRLRMSNQQRDEIVWLLQHDGVLQDADRKPWSQVQPILISPWIEDLLKLSEAEAVVYQRDTRGLEWCRERLRWPSEQLNPPPLVRGDDLIALGIPRGPAYSQLLQKARTAQLDGVFMTREEALAWLQREAENLDNHKMSGIKPPRGRPSR